MDPTQVEETSPNIQPPQNNPTPPIERTTPTPPTPAPRRSNRIRSIAHLRPDFAYNFQTNSDEGDDISKKVLLLKQFMELLN